MKEEKERKKEKRKCENPHCEKKVETFYKEYFCSKKCYDYCCDWEGELYEEGQTY